MAVLATLPSFAEPRAKIFIGEQPPLFSSSGGIVDEVVAASLKAAGRGASYEWLPIGRMLVMLREDSLDVYVTPSNTPGQQHPHVDFLEARGVFFYKKARFPELKAAKLEDLAGRSVATVLNSPNTPLFSKAGMTVEEGPYETFFTKLDKDRVDFVATADVGGILTIRKLFPGREDEFASTELAYSSIKVGLYAKSDPAILAAAKEGFEKIRCDGTLDEMLKRFFGSAWTRVRILR